MLASLPEYLLDTGVANRLALQDPGTVARLASASFIYVPTIVLGELYYGAYLYAYRHKSTKFLDLYDAFLAQYHHQLVAGDDGTAQIYGAICADLQATGRPMQQNDVWIAAIARQYGLTVATVDRDFLRIARLAVEMF
jgi:tRNA(fMet)-specific endonuclease VapC